MSPGPGHSSRQSKRMGYSNDVLTVGNPAHFQNVI
jgi:hypothetical protein